MMTISQELMHQVETHHQLLHHLDHHHSLLILTLTLILAVTTGANQPSTEDSWLRLDRVMTLATPNLATLTLAQAHQVQAHQAHHQALIQVTAQTLIFHHQPLQKKMAPKAQHQDHVNNLLALLLLKMMDNNTQALIMIILTMINQTVVQDSENYWPRLDLARMTLTTITLTTVTEPHHQPQMVSLIEVMNPLMFQAQTLTQKTDTSTNHLNHILTLALTLNLTTKTAHTNWPRSKPPTKIPPITSTQTKTVSQVSQETQELSHPPLKVITDIEENSEKHDH
jgi:hypothetical protein